MRIWSWNRGWRRRVLARGCRGRQVEIERSSGNRANKSRAVVTHFKDGGCLYLELIKLLETGRLEQGKVIIKALHSRPSSPQLDLQVSKSGNVVLLTVSASLSSKASNFSCAASKISSRTGEI